MATIKQLDHGRQNNFDLLRFIAATMVVFSHSFLVTANFSKEPLLHFVGFIDFGALGVKIFFAISGFLITKSLFRQPSPGRFVWARLLRIFPGLFMTAFFCAFIIGPICTALPLSNYFTNSAVYDFLWRLITLHNFGNTLPGTFNTNPYPNNVNSPLWTLPTELLMYQAVLLLGIVLLIIRKQFKMLWASIPLLIITCSFFYGMHFNSYYTTSWATLFVMGSLCYVFSNKIRIVLNIPILLIMLAILYVSFHYRMPFFIYVFDAFLVYGILVFSYHPQLQFKSFHKLGDFSYGLYIYAFPIQQLLMFKFPLLQLPAHFLFSFSLALIMAILSWYFVEKPMLKLKTTRLPKF